jgi:ADP-ribosylglycohydrolase
MHAFDPAALTQLSATVQTLDMGLAAVNTVKLWPSMFSVHRSTATMASARLSHEALDRANASLFAAVMGDSLSLTTHYEYDSQKIRESYEGEMDPVKLLPPGWLTGGKTNTPGLAHKQWHPGKRAGDNTDYGDYTIMTMKFIAGAMQSGLVETGFDKDAYHKHWRGWIAGYTGYVNFATKETMQRMQQGAIGSEAASRTVNDLAPVARVPPLLFLFGSSGRLADEDRLAAAARAVCTVTHRAALALSAAEFFARVAHKVMSAGGGGSRGQKSMAPSEAIERTIAQMEASELAAGVGSPNLNSAAWWARMGLRKAAEAATPNSALFAQPEEEVDDLACQTILGIKWCRC